MILIPIKVHILFLNIKRNIHKDEIVSMLDKAYKMVGERKVIRKIFYLLCLAEIYRILEVHDKMFFCREQVKKIDEDNILKNYLRLVELSFYKRTTLVYGNKWHNFSILESFVNEPKTLAELDSSFSICGYTYLEKYNTFIYEKNLMSIFKSHFNKEQIDIILAK